MNTQANRIDVPAPTTQMLTQHYVQPAPAANADVAKAMQHLADQSLQIIESHGYIVFNNMPQFEEDAARDRMILDLGHAMGQPFHFDNEGGDYYVTNLRPSTNVNKQEISFKSGGDFFLHTDLTYRPHPVDIMFFYVVRQNPEAMTLLSNLDDALSLLPEWAIEELYSDENYVFSEPERAGIPRSEETHARPILTRENGLTKIRYRRDLIHAQTDKALQALELLTKALEDASVTFHPTPGTLVVVDNKRCLHARTHFTPTFNPVTDRHIKRLYVYKQAA